MNAAITLQVCMHSCGYKALYIIEIKAFWDGPLSSLYYINWGWHEPDDADDEGKEGLIHMINIK